MLISIVHLSDIHFKVKETDNRISRRVDELAGAIRANTMGVKYVFLAVTGDVAFSGNQKEYLHAKKFFIELRDKLSSDGSKNIELIFIPGNHDCDFSGDQGVRNLLVGKIGEEEIKDSILNECSKVQSEYWNFYSDFNQSQQLEDYSRIFEIKRFSVDEKNISFYLLNTSWMSSLSEQQRLIYPIEKILPEQEKSTTSEVVITMLHHPYTWFEANNARKLRGKLEEVSDLILTGHEHESETFQKIKPEGLFIEYIEGGVLSDKSIDNSGFNIIKIDTSKKDQELIIIAWNAKKGIYESIGERVNIPFTRNQKRPTLGINLQEEFERDLDDIGIKYSHPSTEIIRLEDLFVLPQLRKLSASSSKQFDKSIIRDRIETFIKNNQFVIIIGAEKSGKTALSKVLFKSFLKSGLLPLLIDGPSIKSCEESRVISSLKRKIDDIYSIPGNDKFFQQEKSKRAIIIDDFHKNPLNDKGREKLVTFLKDYFEIIIIIGNEQLRFSELIPQDDDYSTRFGFIVCEIMGMGHVKRSELIKKWYLLGQDFYSIQDGDLQKKIVSAEKTISSLLGRNFIPPYPFFILAILQQLEAGTPITTSSGTYGYMYEALLTMALSKIGTRSIILDTYYSYLSEFAYFIFSKKILTVEKRDYEIWHKEYCNKYRLNLDLNAILEGLNSVSIIKIDSSIISFRYPYIYYYFVGRYFHNHITEAHIKDLIQWMSERLHQTDSANIIIFLCHLSKDPFILETLLSKSRNLFSKYSEFNIKEDATFLSDMLSDIPILVLEDNPESNHKKELEKKDEAEENACLDNDDGNDLISLEDKPDIDLEEFMQLNVAFKNIQILGQLLKNYPGSWQGPQKYDLVQECYSLGLRVLKFMFTGVEGSKHDIIQGISEFLKRENPTWDSEKIYKGIRIYIFSMLEGMTYAVTKHIANAVGHDNFSLTFDELLLNFPENYSYKYIDLAVKLDCYKDFPKSQVFELAKIVRKNNFASFLLHHYVWYYFYIFPSEDFALKKSVCDRLGIKLPSQLPSGKS